MIYDRSVLSRRTLLKFAFAGAALPLISCAGDDDSKRPLVIPAEVPEDLRILLQQLDPSVSRRLLESSADYSEKVLLADFFVASLSGVTPSGWSPILLVPDTSGDYARPLDVSVQRRIVNAQSFRFFKTPGRTTVIVYDSRSQDLRRKGEVIDTLHSQITQYLTDLAELVGFLPNSAWLHIQILEKANTNFTVGLNVYLTEVGMSYSGIVAHELFHIYNSKWSGRLPLFITEGLADVASFVVTGSTLSEQYVTTQPVHLSITTGRSLSYARYNEETANGYHLFLSLLREVGLDNFRRGLGEALSVSTATAETTLKPFKKWAPNPSKVEALYKSRIADYIPDSY